MSEASQLTALAESLKSTGGEYAKVSNELVAELSFLGSIAEELQTTWKGTSSQAFMSAWNRGIRDGAYLSEALANASSAMVKLASVIESNVAAIATLASLTASEFEPPLLGPVNSFPGDVFPLTVPTSPKILVAQTAANTARANISAAASVANGTIEGLTSTVGICSNGQGPLPPKWTALPQPGKTMTRPDGTTVIVVYIEGKGLQKFTIPPGGLPPGDSGNLTPDCPDPSGWGKIAWFLGALMVGATANSTSAFDSWLKGDVQTNALESQVTSNLIGSLIAGGATLNLLKKYSKLCATNNYALAIAQSLIGGFVGGNLSHFLIQPYVLNPIFGAPKPNPTPKKKAQPAGPSNPNNVI